MNSERTDAAAVPEDIPTDRGATQQELREKSGLTKKDILVRTDLIRWFPLFRGKPPRAQFHQHFSA